MAKGRLQEGPSLSELVAGAAEETVMQNLFSCSERDRILNQTKEHVLILEVWNLIHIHYIVKLIMLKNCTVLHCGAH